MRAYLFLQRYPALRRYCRKQVGAAVAGVCGAPTRAHATIFGMVYFPRPRVSRTRGHCSPAASHPRKVRGDEMLTQKGKEPQQVERKCVQAMRGSALRISGRAENPCAPRVLAGTLRSRAPWPSGALPRIGSPARERFASRPSDRGVCLLCTATQGALPPATPVSAVGHFPHRHRTLAEGPP